MDKLRRLTRMFLEWVGIFGLLLAFNVPNAFTFSLLLHVLYCWWQDYRPNKN
jgi:hypothetical protein